MTQQVIKEKGGLLNVPALLKEKGSEEIVLVVGQHLLNENHFNDLLSKMEQPYQLVHPPAGVLQVKAIPEIENLDTVIAIGGGKVMDFAKGIIHKYGKARFFIAAPTTAGSGSEATPIAVFYEGKEKVSLDAPGLLPHCAVLDAALLTNLPPLQRAISGADAMAQCIESIWNVHSTPTSESFALTGLETLWKGLTAFVKEDNSEEATEQILWAAYLGGKAIALTRTTGPHALSYYLTASYHVPHGQAVALTLPLFFLYNGGMGENPQMEKIYRVMGVQNAEEAFRAMRHFLKGLGLAITLADVNLQDIDLHQWLQSVNQQRFTNNPVTFDGERLRSLFMHYLV